MSLDDKWGPLLREQLVSFSSAEWLEQLRLRLQNRANHDKFLLCEVGWFLIAQSEFQWQPSVARLLGALVLQTILCLDAPLPWPPVSTSSLTSSTATSTSPSTIPHTHAHIAHTHNTQPPTRCPTVQCPWYYWHHTDPRPKTFATAQHANRARSRMHAHAHSVAARDAPMSAQSGICPPPTPSSLNPHANALLAAQHTHAPATATHSHTAHTTHAAHTYAYAHAHGIPAHVDAWPSWADSSAAAPWCYDWEEVLYWSPDTPPRAPRTYAEARGIAPHALMAAFARERAAGTGQVGGNGRSSISSATSPSAPASAGSACASGNAVSGACACGPRATLACFCGDPLLWRLGELLLAVGALCVRWDDLQADALLAEEREREEEEETGPTPMCQPWYGGADVFASADAVEAVNAAGEALRHAGRVFALLQRVSEYTSPFGDGFVSGDVCGVGAYEHGLGALSGQMVAALDLHAPLTPATHTHAHEHTGVQKHRQVQVAEGGVPCADAAACSLAAAVAAGFVDHPTSSAEPQPHAGAHADSPGPATSTSAGDSIRRACAQLERAAALPLHGAGCALRLHRWASALLLWARWSMVALEEDCARPSACLSRATTAAACDTAELLVRACRLSELLLAPLAAVTPPCVGPAEQLECGAVDWARGGWCASGEHPHNAPNVPLASSTGATDSVRHAVIAADPPHALRAAALAALSQPLSAPFSTWADAPALLLARGVGAEAALALAGAVLAPTAGAAAASMALLVTAASVHALAGDACKVTSVPSGACAAATPSSVLPVAAAGVMAQLVTAAPPHWLLRTHTDAPAHAHAVVGVPIPPHAAAAAAPRHTPDTATTTTATTATTATIAATAASCVSPLCWPRELVRAALDTHTRALDALSLLTALVPAARLTSLFSSHAQAEKWAPAALTYTFLCLCRRLAPLMGEAALPAVVSVCLGAEGAARDWSFWWLRDVASLGHAYVVAAAAHTSTWTPTLAPTVAAEVLRGSPLAPLVLPEAAHVDDANAGSPASSTAPHCPAGLAPAAMSGVAPHAATPCLPWSPHTPPAARPLTLGDALQLLLAVLPATLRALHGFYRAPLPPPPLPALWLRMTALREASEAHALSLQALLADRHSQVEARAAFLLAQVPAPVQESLAVFEDEVRELSQTALTRSVRVAERSRAELVALEEGRARGTVEELAARAQALRVALAEAEEDQRVLLGVLAAGPVSWAMDRHYDTLANALFFARGYALPNASYLLHRNRPYREGPANPHRFRLHTAHSQMRRMLAVANDQVAVNAFQCLVVHEDPHNVLAHWAHLGQGAFGAVFAAELAPGAGAAFPPTGLTSDMYARAHTNARRHTQPSAAHAHASRTPQRMRASVAITTATTTAGEDSELPFAALGVLSQDGAADGWCRCARSHQSSDDDSGVLYNPFEPDPPPTPPRRRTRPLRARACSDGSRSPSLSPTHARACTLPPPLHGQPGAVPAAAAEVGLPPSTALPMPLARRTLDLEAQSMSTGPLLRVSRARSQSHTRTAAVPSPTAHPPPLTAPMSVPLHASTLALPPTALSPQYAPSPTAPRVTAVAAAATCPACGLPLLPHSNVSVASSVTHSRNPSLASMPSLTASSSTASSTRTSATSGVDGWLAPLGAVASWLGWGAPHSPSASARRRGAEMVAVKQISLESMEGRQAGVRETLTLARCAEHPNLVRFLGTYEHEGALWLVMRLCDGGTLAQFSQHNALSEGCVAYVAGQVLKGLSFMHSSRRVHRDVKPTNVLLHLDGSVVLGDLGLAVEHEEASVRTSMAGTEHYLSPEMVCGEGYTPKTDIWSLGCLLVELCNREPPYRNLSTLGCLFALAVHAPPALHEPHVWSPLLRDFISLCLTKDQHLRPSADVLLQHEFIASAVDKGELSALFTHVFLDKALKAVGLV